MRIDIHTKKVKQGDSEHRNIDVEKFTEIIRETDVKILAITNHNHFDFEQYIEFKNNVEGICQIWDGVEFDILEEGRRAHLITIVNPKNAQAFSEKINVSYLSNGLYYIRLEGNNFNAFTKFIKQ